MTTTNYLGNKFLEHIVNKTAMPAMAPTYLALFTSAPTVNGGGTEVSGDAYARVNVTGKFGTAANKAIANNAVIAFATPTGDGWGDITHAALMDATSGGNMLKFDDLETPKNVAAGDPPSFAVGELIFRA